MTASVHFSAPCIETFMQTRRIMINFPLPSARQHPSCGDCQEVKREYYQNSSVLCRVVWHNVHSLQHTYMSSSYRSNRLGLSHWDPYAVRRGGCLELYYCNMVEWFSWDSSLILTPGLTGFLHCFDSWFGHLACKNRLRNDLLRVEWDVKPYTLTHTHSRMIIESNRRTMSGYWAQ